MMHYIIELVRKWAEERNLVEGSTPQAQMLKLLEETGELAAGVAKGNKELVVDSIGDIMVVLTVLCAQYNIDLPECYRIAYNEIKNRNGKMVDGVFIKEDDIA